MVLLLYGRGVAPDKPGLLAVWSESYTVCYSVKYCLIDQSVDRSALGSRFLKFEGWYEAALFTYYTMNILAWHVSANRSLLLEFCLIEVFLWSQGLVNATSSCWSEDQLWCIREKNGLESYTDSLHMPNRVPFNILMVSLMHQIQADLELCKLL